MYHILVEAAGLRQLRRIEPAWVSTFTAALANRLGQHGFKPVGSSRDVTLFRADPLLHEEPHHVAWSLRSVLDFLSGADDYLIDHSVVCEYLEEAGDREAMDSCERLLLDAREPRSAYLGQRAFAALGPFFEVAWTGRVARVVAVRVDAGPIAPQLVAGLDDEGRIDELVDVLTSDAPLTWVRSSDQSRADAAIGEAIRRAGDDSRPAVSMIRCRGEVCSHDAARDLARILPFDVRHRADLAEREMEHALEVLRERFFTPRGTVVNRERDREEVRFLVGDLLSRVSHEEGRFVVWLAGLDECEPAEAARLVALCRTNPQVRVLVSAVSAPPDADWQSVCLDDADDERHPPAIDRFKSLVDYWRDTDVAGDYLAAASPTNHRRALYLVARTWRILADRDSAAVFPRIGISLAERARLLHELQRVGATEGDQVAAPHPAAEVVVGDLLQADERDTIESEIRAVVEERIAVGDLPVTEAVLEHVAPSVEGAHREVLVHQALHSAAAAGAAAALDRIGAESGLRSATRSLSIDSARIRFALRGGAGPDSVRDIAARLTAGIVREAPAPRLKADMLLSLGELSLADRDFDRALRAAKDAMLAQPASATGADRREAAAAGHLLMGRILMARQRLTDAGHYLGFAREEAIRDRPVARMAEALEVIRQYITGNLTTAGRGAAGLAETLLRDGSQDWFLLMWLIRARVEFDLGDYAAADRRFAALGRYAEVAACDDAAAVAAVWRSRAQTFGERGEDGAAAPREAPGGAASGEARLMYGEALARAGQFERAVEVLAEAEEAAAAGRGWPRLGPSWENGFAAIEDMCIAGADTPPTAARIACAIRAWSLAHLGRHDESAELFFGLTRGPGAWADDPNAAFYHYLYASVLPRERSADRDDRVTVLGKAIKLLKERTSRIEDHRERTRYLERNRWNHALMQDAREHNLV